MTKLFFINLNSAINFCIAVSYLLWFIVEINLRDFNLTLVVTSDQKLTQVRSFLIFRIPPPRIIVMQILSNLAMADDWYNQLSLYVQMGMVNNSFANRIETLSPMISTQIFAQRKTQKTSDKFLILNFSLRSPFLADRTTIYHRYRNAKTIASA